MRKPKIVVIEDDPKTRRLISTMLDDRDYDLVMATDGEDGLEKVRLHLPDLVITDILLPEKDGYVVLEAMKRDPALKRVPVILISAIYVSEVDRRRGLKLGADHFLLKPDAFLSKPFRANALLDAIQITLGEKRPPESEENEPIDTVVVASRIDKDRRLLVRRLEAQGYKAVEIDKIEDAAQSIHLEQPAAVIVDVDRLEEPAEWMRGLDREFPESAFIVLASDDGEWDPIEVMRAGASDLRSTPLDFDLFFHSLHEAIENKRHRAARTELTEQLKRTTADLLDRIARLEASNRVLEKKNRELVEVNQLVSHDLKKPLTVFKTVISLMHQGRLGELNAKQTDAVQNCAESVRYMEDLISDILDSSRLDYDGQEFDFREVDMTLLIGALVRRLRHHLEDQSVRVRVDPLPVVCGDESALQKVFMNLIGNAVNYRDPNREGLIRISGREEHGAWVLRVADNGIGIPEPDQLTIWQKFKRGANTQGVSGTGLGLYIVHQLVRGHGGAIDLESTVGEGTTFAVRLPKAPVVQEHSPLA